MNKAVILFGIIIFEEGKAIVQKIQNVEMHPIQFDIEPIAEDAIINAYDGYVILEKFKGEIVFIEDFDQYLLDSEAFSQDDREYIIDLWFNNHVKRGIDLHTLYVVYKSKKLVDELNPPTEDYYEVVAGYLAARKRYNEFINEDDTWTAGFAKMLDSTDHDPNSRDI